MKWESVRGVGSERPNRIPNPPTSPEKNSPPANGSAPAGTAGPVRRLLLCERAPPPRPRSPRAAAGSPDAAAPAPRPPGFLTTTVASVSSSTRRGQRLPFPVCAGRDDGGGGGGRRGEQGGWLLRLGLWGGGHECMRRLIASSPKNQREFGALADDDDSLDGFGSTQPNHCRARTPTPDY